MWVCAVYLGTDSRKGFQESGEGGRGGKWAALHV